MQLRVRRILGALPLVSVLALAAACSSSTSSPSGSGTAGAAGSAGTDGATADPGSGGAGGGGGTGDGTGGTGGTGGGGGTADDAGAPSDDAATGAGGGCDPAPAAGSLFALTDTRLGDPTPASMCDYRGQVLFIFNAAQLCGYTPQTTAIQGLQKAYSGQRFTVLGFYSNDFGNQGGDPAACNAHFGVTFDTFDIAPVTGPNARPVFAWLESQPNPGPATTLPPEWNFSKYLISRDGKLVGHWLHTTVPDAPEIKAAIEAEIAKP